MLLPAHALCLQAGQTWRDGIVVSIGEMEPDEIGAGDRRALLQVDTTELLSRIQGIRAQQAAITRDMTALTVRAH